MVFFSFPSTRRENEAETRWGAREGTRRGEGGGDRGPEGREAAERGGRLASVCGSSGTSAMVAEPRGCCADPPPTPRSGPAHLAVSNVSIGVSGRDARGERTNRRRKAGLGAGCLLRLSLPFSFFFLFFLFFLSLFFFLFNKRSRRQGKGRGQDLVAARPGPWCALRAAAGTSAMGSPPQAWLCAWPALPGRRQSSQRLALD